MKAALDAEPNIEWLIGRAGRMLVEHGRVVGLAMEDGDAYALPRAGHHDRHVSERADSHRPGTAPGGARRRTAVARAGRVAQVVRLRMGPAEDRHAAAADRDSIDFDAQSRAADSASSAATSRRCRSRFCRRRSIAPQIDCTCFTPTIASAISCAQTSRSRRCSTGRFTASVRAIARRSRTRSSASRTRSGIRSSSSRKGSTRARST